MLLFLLWLRLDNNLLQRFVVFGFDSARRDVNRRESQWIVVSRPGVSRPAGRTESFSGTIGNS